MTRAESPVLARVEWVAAIAITALIILAHVELRRHVGPLWRDEAATVHVATMPSLPELWAGLEFDSFPACAALVIRSVAAVFGPVDAVLRTFGLLVGLALLWAVWWNVRTISRSLPLLSLALLGGSSVVIRYGDSLRGYGMGTVLILFAFGLLWRMVQEPSIRSITVAFFFSLLSVQCLYQNVIFLFAVCCGGAAVGLLRKSWKIPAIFGGIGLTSVLSLLPYAPIMARTREWNILLKHPVDLAGIGQGFAESVGLSGSVLAWMWLALFAIAMTACGSFAWASAAADTARERERSAFLGAAGLVGAAGYAVFLRALGYPPRTWYYVPAVVFLAAVLDAALEPLLRRGRTLRVMRLVAALLLIAVASIDTWPDLQVRQTRVDRAATRLQHLASKDDLIVVDPWEYGISFMRYYRGSAPWTTLPSLSDHRTHRYDLVKRAMLAPTVMDPILEDVAATLRSGHRVWLVGRTEFPPPAEGLPPLQLPPLQGSAWHAEPYMLQWSDQLSRFLRDHANVWVVVPLPPDEPVNRYEDLELHAFVGWSG